MTRDIKQRHSVIKDIKTLDKVESLKRKLHHPDIKIKLQSQETEKQETKSFEATASDSITHGAKKVVLQEFYSSNNIYTKVSNIRHNNTKQTNKIKEIPTKELEKSFNTRYTKNTAKQKHLFLKRSNCEKHRLPLKQFSNDSSKIKSKNNYRFSQKTSNKSNDGILPISNNEKFKSVNKIPDKNVFKKIFQYKKKTVKKALAAIKSLSTIFSIGASTFIFVIILICIVCIITSSPFSIFFSNEKDSGDNSLQYAIIQVNKEYNKQIHELRSKYDNITQTRTIINDDENMRMRDVWQDVLIVYTIRTYSQDRNFMYFDEQRIKELQKIFFQCISISATVNEQNKLQINVTAKRYKELSYSNEEQKMIEDLMDGKNDYLWNSLLDGIFFGNGNIVETALTQVGNVGGEPYWTWYGYPSRVEWCACFVSWVADQNGYIEADIIPKFSNVQQGIAWFEDRSQFQNRDYVPNNGDIIFFDWQNDNFADHVGIVEKVENGTVFTIEGNSLNDECLKRDYSIGSIYIFGYGTPNY